MTIFEIDNREVTNENIKDILLNEPESEYDKWFQNKVKQEILVFVNKLKRVVNRKGCDSYNTLKYLQANIEPYYETIEEQLGIKKEIVIFMIDFVTCHTRLK